MMNPSNLSINSSSRFHSDSTFSGQGVGRKSLRFIDYSTSFKSIPFSIREEGSNPNSSKDSGAKEINISNNVELVYLKRKGNVVISAETPLHNDPNEWTVKTLIEQKSILYKSSMGHFYDASGHFNFNSQECKLTEGSYFVCKSAKKELDKVTYAFQEFARIGRSKFEHYARKTSSKITLNTEVLGLKTKNSPENIKEREEKHLHFLKTFIQANQGNWYSQLALAKLFKADGNPEEAFNYMKLAADRGLPEAKHLLSLCYYRGIGTELNKEQGFKNLKEAIQLKVEKAQRTLELFCEKKLISPEHLKKIIQEHTSFDRDLVEKIIFFLIVDYPHDVTEEEINIFKRPQIETEALIEAVIIASGTEVRTVIMQTKKEKAIYFLANYCRYYNIHNGISKYYIHEANKLISEYYIKEANKLRCEQPLLIAAKEKSISESAAFTVKPLVGAPIRKVKTIGEKLEEMNQILMKESSEKVKSIEENIKEMRQNYNYNNKQEISTIKRTNEKRDREIALDLTELETLKNKKKIKLTPKEGQL